MSVSDDPVDRPLQTVSLANCYDLVLAVIPATLLFGGTVAGVTTVPWRQAVVAAALSAVVGDACSATRR